MAGGIGLKPVIKLVCPIDGCEYTFRFHCKDQKIHPDMWVMTKESREHLAIGHAPRPKLYIVKDEPPLAA